MIQPWSNEEDGVLSREQKLERLVKEGGYDRESAQYVLDILNGDSPEPEGGLD